MCASPSFSRAVALGLVLTVLSFAAPAAAQLAQCPVDPVTAEEGRVSPFPDGLPLATTAFVNPRIVTESGDTLDLQIDGRATGWSVSPDDFDRLSADEEALTVVWDPRSEGDEGCQQVLTVAGDDPEVTDPAEVEPEEPGDEEGEPTAEGGDETEGGEGDGDEPPDDPEAQVPIEEIPFGPAECRRAGRTWESQIGEAARTDSAVTILVFRRGAGNVCYRNRDYGVFGDPIYVGLFTPRPELLDDVQVEFDPCALEPAAPSILESGDLSMLVSPQQAADWHLLTYLPRACYNQSVTVTLSGPLAQDSGRVSMRSTLQQHKRYRATVQAGVIFTDLHDRRFGLGPGEGETMVVFDRGPSDTGPEYFASLVLYSITRYIPFVNEAIHGSRAYKPRDIVNENRFFDRIGAVIGLGLEDFGDQFVLGFTFEVVPGLNAAGLWIYQRRNELAGLDEGDEFDGRAEDIPTRRVWDVSGFEAGISIDIGYLSGLIGR